MANVTSVIDKSIKIIMTMTAQAIFSSVDPRDHKVIWSVSRHRANNIFKLPPLVSLVAIEIKSLHGDLRVSKPRTNSFLCLFP